jgi:hemerythrin-like domain-containing protein
MVTLSSDHHQALVQARKLSRASEPGDPALLQAAAAAFIAFWMQHTVPHFREEEEILLPAFALHGDPHAEPVVRMLVEHVQLWSLVRSLAIALEEGYRDAATASALGAGLAAHIRFEENVLFPLIEAAMPAEALDRLGRELQAAHAD